MWLFDTCYEWRTDGGEAASRHDRKKVIRTGYYSRVEWPSPGGVMKQFKFVPDIFAAIENERMKMFRSKIR